MHKGDTKTQANLRDQFTKQPVTSPYIHRIRSYLTPGATLLDIGCGTGHILNLLSDPKYTLIGLDISSAMIQTASHNTQVIPRPGRWVITSLFRFNLRYYHKQISTIFFG